MLTDPERSLMKINEASLNKDGKALINSAAEAVDNARRYQPDHLVPALVAYAKLLEEEGAYETAASAAQEVLQLEMHTRNAIEALTTLGVCAAQAGQLDKAEQEFNRAVDLSRKMDYPQGFAHAMQHLVNEVLLVRGQFHLALTFTEETGILLDKHGLPSWYESYIRAFIFEKVGDRRLCRLVLDDLLSQIQPGTQLAAAYYFLWSRLAMDEDEMEQAGEYLRLGLRVANQVYLADLDLLIRLGYSRYYREIREAPVARNWAENALQQARQKKMNYYVGLALIERAQDYWEVGNLVSAEADLNEAINVLEPLQAASDLTRIQFLRALWYYQAARPEAEAAWMDAAKSIMQNGYAYLLEEEQEVAFPLIAAHVRSKNQQTRTVTEAIMRHLAKVPPPPLRVASLGHFAVWKGRRRVADSAWTRRKAGELFRYLLLQTSRAAGREVIIEALWPDSDSGNPYDLLHQCTSAVRHALEPDLPDKFPSRYLKVEGEHIALILPPGSEVDFEQFERALPPAIQGENIDRLTEGLNLYAGELFPSDRYADWSAEKRQALADLRQRGLLVLAQAYLKQSEFFNALNCCRQVLRDDAWSEEATLLIMQAYIGIRDIPHAIAAYMALERRLKEDLDTLPGIHLRQLVEKLRKREL